MLQSIIPDHVAACAGAASLSGDKTKIAFPPLPSQQASLLARAPFSEWLPLFLQRALSNVLTKEQFSLYLDRLPGVWRDPRYANAPLLYRSAHQLGIWP